MKENYLSTPEEKNVLASMNELVPICPKGGGDMNG